MKNLTVLAMQTNNGAALVAHVLETLRQRKVVMPALNVIERICAEAITRANHQIYKMLINPLTKKHLQRLKDLLKIKPNSNITWLAWLRQSPLKPNSRYMLEHIERIKVLKVLALPEETGRDVHQNRLLKMAREGAQMTSRDIANLEEDRLCGTLVALVLEGTATVTDELVDLHDRIMGKMFNAAKNKHEQQFQDQGKEINSKVR
jgi:hypothetical protein